MPLLSGLQAGYRLDTDLNDYSGAARHASGSVTFDASGVLDGALASGTGSVNPWTGITAKPFSFSLWFKPTNPGGGFVRFNTGASGINSRSGLQWNSSGQIFRDIGAGSGLITTVAIDQWWHLVLTVPASGDATWYLNGSSSATSTFNPTAAFLTLNFNATANSLLDMLLVYNRALTAAEVTELYNSGDGLDPTADYHLITGSWEFANITGSWEI